jgi:hypothetical protein
VSTSPSKPHSSAKAGVIRRTGKRILAVFIDGVNLDRATRRLNRRVDMAALLKGVSSGLTPVLARYYTLLPSEDDSRQRAYLDAVERAGLEVIVKRLPPKGTTRQVSIDVEMAADIAAFAAGREDCIVANRAQPEFSEISYSTQAAPVNSGNGSEAEASAQEPIRRIVTLVCPTRELVYPISLANSLGADTITADFGKAQGSADMKQAAKWIDLSDSETIWKE